MEFITANSELIMLGLVLAMQGCLLVALRSSAMLNKRLKQSQNDLLQATRRVERYRLLMSKAHFRDPVKKTIMPKGKIPMAYLSEVMVLDSDD